MPRGSLQEVWASQKGFYVHQRAGYLALKGDLTINQLKVIASAHELIDSKKYQSAEWAYLHAMREPNQDIYTANKMANAFVREKFNTAWQYRNNGNTEKALFEFGLALHTLQDSTSSSHADFQPWSGHETKYQEFQHVIKEMRQPNMDNQLYKITKDAYQWYKSGKLPKGDLFQR